MSREVRHGGAGAFYIRFSFDRQLVDLIKTLPHRRWNAAERHWWVPEQDVVQLVELLQPERFCFDEATRDLYRQSGGTLPLPDEAPDSPVPRLPGLFDDEPSLPGDAPGGDANDYTVSDLNRQVQRVLEQAFPQPVWIVGEISGFNRNTHKRHVTFQLVEKGEDGKTVSSVDATLFEQARRTIRLALERAGRPFELEDEITVRMRVRIELYVPWGSYRVIVDELDIHYTLGEAARRREEIIRRLTEEGLVGRNTSLPMPALPLRVGLVTSLGSDAYRDVLRTLQESGFAFRVLAHGARVQGHATEPSVLEALDELERRADELDVVIVCRGGGSRTDLAWFDSEALGRAVALFPRPVIVGIGHEQDQSVLDAVGRRSKTPTAAAGLLVDAVRHSLEAVEAFGTGLLALAARRVRDERRLAAEWGRRIALSGRGLLTGEQQKLDHRTSRAGRGARSVIRASVERLARWVRDIPRACSAQLAREQGRLDGWSSNLGPSATRSLVQETERMGVRDRRLYLLHPRRVLERGYSILRVGGSGVLSTAELAPPGTVVRAELKQGSLKLRSEGATDDGGGN